MKGQTSLFLILLLVILVAFIGVGFVFQYNGFVKAEKSVEETLAQIATVCQRRLDLIPNLVETVKGYAQHEQQTLVAVTQMRNQAINVLKANKDGSSSSMAAIANSQAEVTKSMRGLFAVIEKYPQLRASSNFMSLQDQLEGTENRIAVSRQRYNSAARLYNEKTQTFPGIIIAPMLGFAEKEYYEVENNNAYQSVKVGF